MDIVFLFVFVSVGITILRIIVDVKSFLGKVFRLRFEFINF